MSDGYWLGVALLWGGGAAVAAWAWWYGRRR